MSTSVRVVDDIVGWSVTSGTTRPYVLGGAIHGSLPFLGNVDDGTEVMIHVSDGVRFERVIARFDAPNELAPLSYERTSNADEPVAWPASGRRMIRALELIVEEG